MLETMQPGPELAAALHGIDRDSLSGDELVSVMIADRRLASHYMAQSYQDIAAIGGALDDLGDEYHHTIEYTAAEIGAALCLTRRSAESETHMAMELTRRLPKVLEALLVGDIDVRRAQVLANGTDHLPVAAARGIIDGIIEEASRLTTGQLTARLRRRCIEYDPQAAVDRYRRTVEDRRVYATPSPEGTANLLGLDLPPERVQAFTRYLTETAQRLRRLGDNRTMDQLRADIYLDILAGTHNPTNATGGGVHLKVDLTTLARLDNQPGELAGYGPIIADVARQIADHQHSAQWSYLVTDPQTGNIVHSGTTRRRPTRPQHRHITAHYPTCVFPGCRMPSIDCDIDHRTPHADGGCSHNHNLAPLCRHHHRIRHQAPWNYQQHPNGDHTWTTPLNRTYTTNGQSP
ncbi:MAG: HNH endonuclease [Acidimicrobiia bacterium]|nr:HNH endonuclease [Acidimicrobiia bacterium]